MIRSILRFAAVPLGLLVVFAVYLGLYNLLGLPQPKEILMYAQSSYSEHAYLMVFLGALGEGLLMFNLYFPGSVMIVFGVTLSKGNPLKALVLVTLVVTAFLIDAVINYALGRYGWYHFLVKIGMKPSLERAKLRVERKGWVTIFSTYIHPNVGALTATSCGILQLPFRTFVLYSLLSLIFWNALWGLIVYYFGSTVLQYASFTAFTIVLILWSLFAVVRGFISHRRQVS
jgi:membrane-associated protein